MLLGYLLTISILIVLQQCTQAELPIIKMEKKGPATELHMSTEAGMEMHQKWMQQAFSGLFSAIASKHLKSLSDESQVDLEECTKNAGNVIKHARCLKKMFKSKEAIKKQATINEESKDVKESNNTNWVGGFRVKRNTGLNVKKAANYDLLGRYSGLTPIGSVAYTINKAMALDKNKTAPTSWQQTIENVRRSAFERKQAKAEMSKRLDEDKTLSNMEMLAFRTLKQKHSQNEVFEDAIDHPERLLEVAEEKKAEANNEPVEKLTNLVKDGIKLGFRLADGNMTEKELDEKTLKLISPRFLSVMPDNETDSLNFISPSLFSLHDKGTGIENLTSLPSLMHEFSAKDQNEWLNLIMEAAGIDDQAKKLDQETSEIRKIKHIENYEQEVRDKDGQPLYFTKQNATDLYGDTEKQKIETFERLISSYTPRQMRDLNTTGFAVMNKQQLKLLYGEGSPYHHNETYNRLTKMSKKFIRSQMNEDVKAIAEMDKFEMRQKDIALSPVLLTPLILVPGTLSNLFIVLSPLVLSPIILSPAVLGPIILSPLVFIPIILSPRVLAPFVLSPFIFTPIILRILSPGVFNPVILSLSTSFLAPDSFATSPKSFNSQSWSRFSLGPVPLLVIAFNSISAGAFWFDLITIRPVARY